MDPNEKGVKIAALLIDQNGKILHETLNRGVGEIGTIKKLFFKNPIHHAE